MNCAAARHLILTADLSAVRGVSDPALRSHLAVCARCAAEASWVVGDTTRLRSAVQARGRQPVVRWSRKRRIAVSLIPVALAAEITLLAVLANRDSRVIAPTARLDDSVYSTAVVNAIPRDTPLVSTPKTTRVWPSSASRPSAAVAKRQDAPLPAPTTVVPDDASIAQVRVTVRDHQRAAIFATSNPKITVVLLSKGDSL